MKIRQHNFTMIEVLTAIALTMVIGWMVNLAFSNTSTVNQKIAATLELHAKGNEVMNVVNADFYNFSQWTKVGTNNGEHELKFGVLLPTYRASAFPVLAKYGKEFWEEANISSFRNEYRGNEWRFMGGVTNNAPNGIPRLMIKRNFSHPGDHSYNTSVAESAKIFNITLHGVTQNLLDIASLGYTALSYNIRDFRMQRKGGTYQRLKLEVYYFNIIVAVKNDDSIPQYVTVSFYMTNAPLIDDDGKPIRSPREGKTDEERLITERYLWVYFQKVLTTQ